RVGVRDDELDVAEAGMDHPVDGVAAASAHADDFDLGAKLRRVFVEKYADGIGMGSSCVHVTPEKLEKLFEQRPDSTCNALESTRANARGLELEPAMRVDAEADRGGERGIVHVVGESADDRLRRGTAHRQVEDLFGDLGHALEHGAAAGEHDPGVQRLLIAGAANLIPE